MGQADSLSKSRADEANRVLVCGLGSLGQLCVATLKAFGVAVSAIDLVKPVLWEVPGLPDMLEQLLIADCRQAGVLEQMGIDRCRAVLLVTGNERMNLECAFAVRALNPQARPVVPTCVARP